VVAEGEEDGAIDADGGEGLELVPALTHLAARG
jgi:hypothetical protein